MASFYLRFGKRLLDLLVAVPLLICLSPLLLVVSLLVRSRLGSPILFLQQRAGHNQEMFTIYKFRSMTDRRNAVGKLLPDEERLTKVGQFLRNTSIDELPELWNVIKGDMSLVGPRPLLVAYIQRHTPDQLRRYEVKPGITGWAQVNGRDSLDWEAKFRLDKFYVDNCNLRLDLNIACLTLFRVLCRKDVSPAGRATPPEFLGTKAKEAA